MALLCQFDPLASAMVTADYGVFTNGRGYMPKNIQEMVDWLEFKRKEKQK